MITSFGLPMPIGWEEAYLAREAMEHDLDIVLALRTEIAATMAKFKTLSRHWPQRATDNRSSRCHVVLSREQAHAKAVGWAKMKNARAETGRQRAEVRRQLANLRMVEAQASLTFERKWGHTP